MEKRVCIKCELEKDITEFHKNRVIKGKQYYKRKCSACCVALQAEKRQKLRDWFQEYKSTLKCEECSDDRHYVLVFHHEDPNKKEYNVSQMIAFITSKERIIEEIAKCRVLCANCHRELHYFESVKAL